MTRPATVSDLREQAEAIAEHTPTLGVHATLAAALVAALADLTVVGKGRTVSTGTYSYDYADLADVVKLTRPILANHGLVVLTPVQGHGDGLSVSVVIMHTSGERFVTEPLTFPHGRDAQATGSWITYMRRYALVAALGMAAGDDDDGASAHPAAPAAPSWDKKMTQFEVKNLVATKGTPEERKEEARKAWEFASGDELTEFGPEVARRIADAWLGRPIDASAGAVEGVSDAPPSSDTPTLLDGET